MAKPMTRTRTRQDVSRRSGDGGPEPEPEPGRSARRLLRGTLLVLALAVAVVAGTGTSGTVAVRLLELAGGVVLGLAVLWLAASLVLAVTAAVAGRRLLRRLPDVEQLGRSFESTHEGVRVAGVDEGADGSLRLDVDWTARQTVVLDDEGLPATMDAGGVGATSLRLTAGDRMPAWQRDLVVGLAEPGVDLDLRQRGVMTIRGPLPTSWELRSGTGVRVRSGR
ncbi:MAG: hypothetical protein ABI807_13275 [Sporichthyaceae bacterium]